MTPKSFCVACPPKPYRNRSCPGRHVAGGETELAIGEDVDNGDDVAVELGADGIDSSAETDGGTADDDGATSAELEASPPTTGPALPTAEPVHPASAPHNTAHTAAAENLASVPM